ncbi:hypothetical protein GCM10008955_03750 [Deinococcus malanensis]|uniref:Uncharacterized protein n=1 Tax=Deinococcus malanensis TaxID=1706855 RepID=A0ABQ2ELY1_9DEIO|nr:hypothetical protein GCM10008955_03750 [Deinococcus malanensis]
MLTSAHSALQMFPDNWMKVPGSKQQTVEQIGASQEGAGCPICRHDMNREVSESVHIQQGGQWSPSPSGDMLYRGHEGPDQVAGEAVTNQLYPWLIMHCGMQHLGQTPGEARTFGLQRRFCVWG